MLQDTYPKHNWMTERGPTLKGATPDIGGAGPLGYRTEGGSYPYNDTMEAQKGQSFLWVRVAELGYY